MSPKRNSLLGAALVKSVTGLGIAAGVIGPGRSGR